MKWTHLSEENLTLVYSGVVTSMWMLLIMNIGVFSECTVFRFCDEACTGNGITPIVGSSRQSKLIGLFHWSTDQRLKPPDKTSLLQQNAVNVNENCTRNSELSSERLPVEVCLVVFLY